MFCVGEATHGKIRAKTDGFFQKGLNDIKGYRPAVFMIRFEFQMEIMREKTF